MHPVRKTNPGVRGGKVQKKNWDGTTHNYYDHDEPELVIQRRRPGAGARHILTNDDIRRFIAIIPEWAQLSQGLRAILLSPYHDYYLGVYNTVGIIKISAWPRSLWVEISDGFYEIEAPLLNRLGVEMERLSWGYLVKYDQDQARAAQLLGTFLHELGHHVDRISGRNKEDSHQGEPYADRYMLEWAEKLWPAYQRAFKL
jgi:hypothetical protein